MSGGFVHCPFRANKRRKAASEVWPNCSDKDTRPRSGWFWSLFFRTCSFMERLLAHCWELDRLLPVQLTLWIIKYFSRLWKDWVSTLFLSSFGASLSHNDDESVLLSITVRVCAKVVAVTAEIRFSAVRSPWFWVIGELRGTFHSSYSLSLDHRQPKLTGWRGGLGLAIWNYKGMYGSICFIEFIVEIEQITRNKSHLPVVCC